MRGAELSGARDAAVCIGQRVGQPGADARRLRASMGIELIRVSANATRMTWLRLAGWTGTASWRDSAADAPHQGTGPEAWMAAAQIRFRAARQMPTALLSRACRLDSVRRSVRRPAGGTRGSHRLPALSLIALLGTAASAPAQAENLPLPDLIDRTRPSVVGVGTVQPTRRPPNKLLGTGFAVGDGSLVVTNFHVVDEMLDNERYETWAVFAGRGKKARVLNAEVIARDREHDLAVMKLDGERLPPLRIGNAASVREGQQIAFTGFPIGAVLGLYPVTHTGIVSAITPIAIPARSSSELSTRMVRRLASPFNVFQLDATAYPGNSGSPVFDLADGSVVAIINQVYVKGTKENVLKDPSAITYAIPGEHIRAILDEASR